MTKIGWTEIKFKLIFIEERSCLRKEKSNAWIHNESNWLGNKTFEKDLERVIYCKLNMNLPVEITFKI